jgi:hypothetical protein
MIAINHLHGLSKQNRFPTQRRASSRTRGRAKPRERAIAHQARRLMALAAVPVLIGLIGVGLLALKTWVFMPAIVP